MTEDAISTGHQRVGAHVLGTFIDALNWDSVIRTILDWGVHQRSSTVSFCNVHSAVTAIDDKALANALRASEMVLPDGAPIAWLLRRRGFKQQTRIAGPDLMLKLCDALQHTSTGVFLFGSSENTLQLLQENLEHQFPKLKIVGALSPRFGDWTREEESQYIDVIRESGAGIVFIGLGCPKQEIWMTKRSRELPGVLLGVGAAFDFHAGTTPRAPQFMRKTGLEWLHRLASEPKRLWRRYLVTNSYFLWYAARDLLQQH